MKNSSSLLSHTFRMECASYRGCFDSDVALGQYRTILLPQRTEALSYLSLPNTARTFSGTSCRADIVKVELYKIPGSNLSPPTAEHL